jgi:hypothetical protein
MEIICQLVVYAVHLTIAEIIPKVKYMATALDAAKLIVGTRSMDRRETRTLPIAASTPAAAHQRAIHAKVVDAPG